MLLPACGDDTSEPSRTVDPAAVTIHEVVQEAPPPCSALAAAGPEERVVGNDRECLVVGPARIDATGVAEAELTEDPFGVAVDLQLSDEAIEEFDRLAARNLGRRMPILVDGRLVSAPFVREASFSGHVRVMGLTREEAADLVRRLHGTPSG